MKIEALSIRKAFGDLEVLKGVDLSVSQGEIVSIMGPSGAGKTTLLQILGTLSTPTSGVLKIDGQTVADVRDIDRFRSEKIGFVFQSSHLLPEFTAEENVMIPAMIAGASKREARKRAAALLDRVGLGHRKDHKPSELSGGEQQRAAIARALVCNPAILLADEPTGNLDSATKEEIRNLLFSIREQMGQTIIIVTHDPELAAACDRTLHMRDGRFE